MAVGRITSLGDLEVPRHAELPMQGVAIWTNPFNKIKVIAIHYTADPTKRSEEWYRETSKNYTPAAWAQEYEISFKTFAGRRVYSAFSRADHVSPVPLTWYKGKEMWCGWDEGRHACVFAQEADRHLYVYGARQSAGAFLNGLSNSQYEDQEFVVSDLGSFIELVVEYRNIQWPGATWRDVGDPSMAFETKHHIGTSVQIFRQRGIKIQMCWTNRIATRRTAVEAWMNYRPTDRYGNRTEGLLIDPSATMIIDGMSGGYCFEKGGQGILPEKNAYSHTQDCLQYIVLSLPHSPAKLTPEREEKEVSPVNMDADLLRKEWRRTAEEREQEAPESWMDY